MCHLGREDGRLPPMTHKTRHDAFSHRGLCVRVRVRAHTSSEGQVRHGPSCDMAFGSDIGSALPVPDRLPAQPGQDGGDTPLLCGSDLRAVHAENVAGNIRTRARSQVVRWAAITSFARPPRRRFCLRGSYEPARQAASTSARHEAMTGS